MKLSSITVAAVQLTSGTDAAANVDAAMELVHAAADQGASYIQLPEYFNYLGPPRNFAAVAESIPGPTTRRMGSIARSRGVTVHLGSLLEISPDPTRCFNTSVVIDETGAIVATYRKVHLFDVDVPDAVAQRESDVVTAGHQLVVAHLSAFELGLSICFDLRFGELYRCLAVNGATVFAVPAAFNAVTGRAHWEILLRARAIENHAFVIAAAQVGSTPEGIATYGHSLIVGPWGEVLGASTANGADVVVATLDLGQVALRRSQIAVQHLRRRDAYESLSDDGGPD